jgi:hypothetical protein
VTRDIRKALDRCVLHLTKLKDFAGWAKRLQPKAGPVLIWFARVGAQHATSATRESRLVRRWIAERGDEAEKAHARVAEGREGLQWTRWSSKSSTTC